jgi:hypothetical protein
MTTIQLKEELHRAIDNASENLLLKIQELVNDVQYPVTDKTKRSQLIDKIFEEDDNLLRRLAE